MSAVELPTTSDSTPTAQKRGVPEGLWIKCPGCGDSIYRKEVERNLNVCPKCKYHMYVSDMTGGCGLDVWATGSRILHAMAAKPAGPFTPVGGVDRDIALPPETLPDS